MAFFTYIMASRPYGTLYAGSTDDIWRRVAEHRAMENPGFTQKYGVTRLVWIEQHERRDQAFRRERRIKEWRRAWKIRLIEEKNPDWADLIEHLDESFSFRDSAWVPTFVGMIGILGGELDCKPL